MPPAAVDRKGTLSFLLITFGVTYLIEGVLLFKGLRLSGVPPLYGQLVLATVMWIPAAATVITVKWITREGFAVMNLRIGPLAPYVASALIVPACFIVIYALTWLTGLSQPDWQMRAFRDLIAAGGHDPGTFQPTVGVVIGIFTASVLIGPVVNGVFAFGEELGWRGYLLPKLLPLGKLKAYVIVGVTWGLWHAPLIAAGFNYPGYPVAGIIAMCGLTTALSLYINEMSLRYRSSILAGWIHGAFNSQANGIWRLLFPVNPLLGGVTGVVGIAVWLAVGIRELRKERVHQA